MVQKDANCRVKGYLSGRKRHPFALTLGVFVFCVDNQ